MGIVEEARKNALGWQTKTGLPTERQILITEEKAAEFAKKIGADESICSVAALLMDTHIVQARKAGDKAKLHISMAIENTETFLKNYNVSEAFKKKVLACIREHHGGKPFSCIEAEICANADAYKFLDFTGLLDSIHTSGIINRSFNDIITLLRKKIEEKRNIISLDICRKEAEENYKAIKAFLDRVKL